MPWDVAIVGGGVVGLATARALAHRGQRVLVLEKEPQLAAHQSGRNSGVVHAGFSYPPGSLKARFSVAGARALRAYCGERGVPFREVGKLVVARSEAETATLERFLAQGRANGVERLGLLDERELREVEPEARGVAALHSPRSAIVDSAALLEALAQEARDLGTEVRLGARLRAARREEGAWALRTPGGWERAARVVTCAGAQADRVVARFGVAPPFRVVPFRGEFYRLRSGREALVRGLLYPVPDPRFPFVGVHFTKRTDGGVLVGPSAVLALGREAYRHVLQPQVRDVAALVGYRGFWRMLARPEVRAQARQELARALAAGRFLRDAQRLLPALRPDDLVRGRSGIRAQMVAPDGRFVEDLALLERDGCVHVLNAVSPGLTSSLPFGEHIAERVLTA